jgi:hypothetical protein
MCQGPFFGRIPEEHADDGPHVRFDVDHENLLVISHEQGAPAIGRQDPANLNRHHVVLHIYPQSIAAIEKNKPLTRRYSTDKEQADYCSSEASGFAPRPT